MEGKKVLNWAITLSAFFTVVYLVRNAGTSLKETLIQVDSKMKEDSKKDIIEKEETNEINKKIKEYIESFDFRMIPYETVGHNDIIVNLASLVIDKNLQRGFTVNEDRDVVKFKQTLEQDGSLIILQFEQKKDNHWRLVLFEYNNVNGSVYFNFNFLKFKYEFRGPGREAKYMFYPNTGIVGFANDDQFDATVSQFISSNVNTVLTDTFTYFKDLANDAKDNPGWTDWVNELNTIH